MLLALALLAAAAAAQDEESPEGPPERQITLVIYGEDRCPESTESEVVVCARRPEEERYRIPPRLRREGQPVEQAWSSRVEIARRGVARRSPEQLLGGRHLRLHRLHPADDPAMDGEPPGTGGSALIAASGLGVGHHARSP